MIPMTPSSSAGYREHECAGEEGSYWPSVSPGVPLSTSGDEGADTKVRKPYTITKQRERWTEEEHQKFLEALKLYGRAWRRIEEHIGTKTAVQIRSHAQKFFSKIERDVTTGAGADTGVAQVIDIPPPRPKRKPTHPYPRKAGRNFGKTTEDECPLTAAGSISSSSGISTATIAEACLKNNVWEQDDPADFCEDAAKLQSNGKKDDGVSRPWRIPSMVSQINVGPPPVSPIIVGQPIGGPPTAVPQAQSGLPPVPIPAFPGVPWGRMFGGGMNPAMMTPAMMTPLMPWAGAASGQGLEDGGAVSAMAATIAAASAWWAMQGAMPPGMMHPALGAMYVRAAPPLAIPTPFLFPQCMPQEVTIAAAPCADGKAVLTTHVVDDGQDVPSCNGSVRSSAMRRAERAQRVKELKARRMGSGNHLMSISSDICGSSPGGSGTNRTVSAGQVTIGNLTSENAVNSLSKGVSLPADLNKVKHVLHGLIRKDREPLAVVGTAEDGNDKRKRFRGGRSFKATTVDADNYQSTAGLGLSCEIPGVLNAHVEKGRSVSGSNSIQLKFSKDTIEKMYHDENPRTEASSGSDVSEDAGAGRTDGNASGEGGPSSNSSACGNIPGGNDRSGSSDGSSDGEAPLNAGRQQEMLQHDRSSFDPNQEDKAADKIGRNPGQVMFNAFPPICKDGERCEKQEAPSRLPRTASIDGDQRKEVTERGQMAFQALFKRDTLPRTFSPPPTLTLGTEELTGRFKSSSNEGSHAKQASVCHMNRCLSAKATLNDTGTLGSLKRTSKDQDTAANTWKHFRGTSSASKINRCESGTATPSSRPTKSLEELQSCERRRNRRSQVLANNWLQLRTDTSTFDRIEEEDEDDQEDESAESGGDEGCKTQHEESFVCKLDLSVPIQEKELSSGLESPGTTSLDLSSGVKGHTLSLSICTGLKKVVSSVSTTRPVKFSGVGFVPYQRASLRVEPSSKKLS